jgi:hypothetical protein
MPQAITVRGQRTAHLPCGQRPAVEAIAVSVLSRREPVIEDANQILRGNAHPVEDSAGLNPLINPLPLPGKVFILALMPYDRADFDYSTAEAPLPKGHAATHIGMFIAWAVAHNLENDFHRRFSSEWLAKLRRREITGRDFFFAACKEQFAEKDLNVEGNEFAEDYYRNCAGERGSYFEDYKQVLAANLPGFWHVADTWQNYDRLAPIIDQRYEQWKNPRPKKRWWHFWK